MWLTGCSLPTPFLSPSDIGNPSHFLGSGKTATVCCIASTWLLPLATAKHPAEEEFSFISQILPFLSQQLLWCSRKGLSYLQPMHVSLECPRHQIWFLPHGSSVIHPGQFAWPSTNNFRCLSLWVSSVVEIGRPLLSGDKPRGHFGLWGSCCRDAKPQLWRGCDGRSLQQPRKQPS